MQPSLECSCLGRRWLQRGCPRLAAPRYNKEWKKGENKNLKLKMTIVFLYPVVYQTNCHSVRVCVYFKESLPWEKYKREASFLLSAQQSIPCNEYFFNLKIYNYSSITINNHRPSKSNNSNDKNKITIKMHFVSHVVNQIFCAWINFFFCNSDIQ